MFPNYGISWERPLQYDLRATLANMTAWNRWIVEIAAKGGGRLYPVAHLSLRNLAWLETQLATLADGGIRLALTRPRWWTGGPCRTPSSIALGLHSSSGCDRGRPSTNEGAINARRMPPSASVAN